MVNECGDRYATANRLVANRRDLREKTTSRTGEYSQTFKQIRVDYNNFCADGRILTCE